MSILFIGPKIVKKSMKKSFLNLRFWCFGAKTRSDSCRILKTVHFGIGDISKCSMDAHLVRILVFFTIWSTNGSLVGVNQWLLCWGEPMAPLLRWTNGSLVGVNQWLPSGHAPSGCTPSGCTPPGAPLRAAPPGPGPLELEGKKLGGKNVPENYTLFLGKLCFSSFHLSKWSDSYLERQISSR